jgi:formate--tetrahydrofolate ligase
MSSSVDNKIASDTTMQPIAAVAEKLAINFNDLEPHGHYMAKVSPSATKGKDAKGKLVLVTAMSPTPAGEGKTTTSIGLQDALWQLGKKSLLCLREPSLGPYFGMKGGATGGGYAQVMPAEKINLHFTGDFHAITSAHNLLSAIIDNHLYWRESELNIKRIHWPRVMDMNDRVLRQMVTGLGGPTNGIPRETGFEITAASEVMAALALAQNEQDLKARLGNIAIGYNNDKQLVYAKDLQAVAAMARLLKEALKPNLVQTLENNPVLMHAGPFANIAHGCNSVIATQMGLQLADYVVTEAGFGADLGAEKFFNIKCRQAQLQPAVTVCVATVRALKMHGGVAKDDLAAPNIAAVKQGLANLGRHLENLKKFNTPAIVAINHFNGDTKEEIDCIKDYCQKRDVKAIVCRHWSDGGAGCLDLAKAVTQQAQKPLAPLKLSYTNELPLWDKIKAVAQNIYGAREITAPPSVHKQLEQLQQQGLGHLPICMAKTQYSFSTDEGLLGAPKDHEVNIRDIKLATGAGFIVAICGNIMTMPGLSRQPAAYFME